jgi:sugar-specific transcriptional regulator TrmB
VSDSLAVDDSEIGALRRLGLTEYEARIYLVLVRMGPIKASEISFFGQIPRTKTYGAIKELERKGLVNIMPGKPEVYVSRSPSEVLVPLVAKLNRDVEDSEGVVQTLTLAYESSKFVKRDIPKGSSEFWEIEGRGNVITKLNSVFADAKKSIIFCTSAAGLIRAYKAHAEALEKAKNRGASIKLLSPISSQNSSIASEIAEIGELKKIEKALGIEFASVDTKELVVIDTKPDDVSTDRGSDSAIWTTNDLLVRLHEHLFDRLWNTLPSKKD